MSTRAELRRRRVILWILTTRVLSSAHVDRGAQLYERSLHGHEDTRILQLVVDIVVNTLLHRDLNCVSSLY